MDVLSSLALGIGLSAACGFRVFIPLLVMGLAAKGGYVSLDGDLSWIASLPALIVFATATVVEVLGYYVPWVDNLLDTIATPAAVIAGILASASVLGELPDALQWTLAAIAGGGAAGLVQASTVAARGVSSAATGGLGNFVVATIENVTAAVLAVLALAVPVLAVLLFLGVAVWGNRKIVRWRKQRRAAA